MFLCFPIWKFRSNWKSQHMSPSSDFQIAGVSLVLVVIQKTHFKYEMNNAIKCIAALCLFNEEIWEKSRKKLGKHRDADWVESFSKDLMWESRKQGYSEEIWLVVERCVCGERAQPWGNVRWCGKAGEGQRTSWESCLIVYWNKACSPSWQCRPRPPPAR